MSWTLRYRIAMYYYYYGWIVGWVGVLDWSSTLSPIYRGRLNGWMDSWLGRRLGLVQHLRSNLQGLKRGPDAQCRHPGGLWTAGHGGQRV